MLMPTRPTEFSVFRFAILLIMVSVIGTVGCAKAPEFRLNAVHKLTLEKEFLNGQELPAAQVKQLGNAMTALFGTPAEPHFPVGNDSLVEAELLRMAAGPVSVDENGTQGLYRQHCAHCHGITGDGSGPTAPFLNPYPRDFRLGKFKFKSTRLFRPPVDNDLKRVLERGIAGTAMPSFAMLPDKQLDALVAYVKYLTIRGQVERVMLEELANMEPDEPFLSEKGSVEEDEYEYQLELVMELIEPILKRWKKAESQVVPVPAVPDDFRYSRSSYAFLGKQLFFGKANCVQCHGETGVGDGQTENYDDWTNEWLMRGRVDLNNPDDVREFSKAGALRPRKIRPRNLRHRVYRGGSRPDDLYRRVRAGIEGTPMAASPGLTDQEVWGLVAYVLDMSYQHVDGRVSTEK